MLFPVRFYIKFNPILLGITIILIGTSCGQTTVTPIDCTGLTPTYTSDIKQILNTSCAVAGCHDAFSQQFGYDFSKYSTALTGSQSGRFVGAIQQKNGYYAMPLGSRLSDSNIQLLTCWVQNNSPQ